MEEFELDKQFLSTEEIMKRKKEQQFLVTVVQSFSLINHSFNTNNPLHFDSPEIVKRIQEAGQYVQDTTLLVDLFVNKKGKYSDFDPEYADLGKYELGSALANYNETLKTLVGKRIVTVRQVRDYPIKDLELMFFEYKSRADFIKAIFNIPQPEQFFPPE